MSKDKRPHTKNGRAPNLEQAKRDWPNFRKGSSTAIVAEIMSKYPDESFSEQLARAAKAGVQHSRAQGALVRLRRPKIYHRK
jgi:hypothetical protein